jgi:aspartyl aminopeptidase
VVPDSDRRRQAPDAADLIAFLDAAPSPYHAVAEAARRLVDAGFVELSEIDDWSGRTGPLFIRRGGSLVAWRDDHQDPSAGFRVIGAHTDSPNLRIQPRPDGGAAGWRQLGVEVYGGALLNSWLDRDLGLSGRVGVTTGGDHEVRLFRDDRALLRIPQLAIHLDRDVNRNGLKLNPQTQLTPVWGLGPVAPEGFRRYLADQLGVDADAIASWDVMAHDVVGARLAGLGDQWLSSARIDNLVSCWAAVSVMSGLGADASDDAGQPDRSPPTTPLIALFDHEEVGSVSATGAASDLLATTVERIVGGRGGDAQSIRRAIAASRCASVDGAHATHPNYSERHDPNHFVAVNAGPVIKHNANVRYATDAETAMWFESACRDAGVGVQHFVSRNDVPCGSTIGPTTAARLGIATVDVGVAQLAMHSARELCGSTDPSLLAAALYVFVTAG